MSSSTFQESISEASVHPLHGTKSLPKWMSPTGRHEIGIVMRSRNCDCDNVSSERKEGTKVDLSDDQLARLNDACNKVDAELSRKTLSEVKRRDKSGIPCETSGRTSCAGWFSVIVLLSCVLLVLTAIVYGIVPIKQMYFWSYAVANVYEEKTHEGWDTHSRKSRHSGIRRSRAWSVKKIRKYAFSVGSHVYNGQTANNKVIQENTPEDILPEGVIRRIRISYNPDNPVENEAASEVKDNFYTFVRVVGAVAVLVSLCIFVSVLMFCRAIILRIREAVKRVGSYDVL